MNEAARKSRLLKEMHRLEFDPPHGISAWYKQECTDELEAVVQGPEDTPYAGGHFKMHVSIPANYPFAPPKVRFVTPIYHPNIDTGGRICLDVLKMPPQGSWKPSQNLTTVLTSIFLLMAEPNPDDGLMPDITAEYRDNRRLFDAKAKASTTEHALQDQLNKTNEDDESSDSEGEENHPSKPPLKRSKTENSCET